MPCRDCQGPAFGGTRTGTRKAFMLGTKHAYMSEATISVHISSVLQDFYIPRCSGCTSRIMFQ